MKKTTFFFRVSDFYFEVTCLQKKKVEMSLGNRTSKCEVQERGQGQRCLPEVNDIQMENEATGVDS